MLTFERVIESKCQKPDDKLIYLEQYTAGQAKRLIKTCNNLDSDMAYQTAKELLKAEYGNEYVVANTFISKLDYWPSIKPEDSESLNELSIFLINCKHTLSNISLNNQLQSPKEIMNIVKKLPYKLREQWRRKAHEAIAKK
jgi:hypothetical protein